VSPTKARISQIWKTSSSSQQIKKRTTQTGSAINCSRIGSAGVANATLQSKQCSQRIITLQFTTIHKRRSKLTAKLRGTNSTPSHWIKTSKRLHAWMSRNLFLRNHHPTKNSVWTNDCSWVVVTLVIMICLFITQAMLNISIIIRRARMSPKMTSPSLRWYAACSKFNTLSRCSRFMILSIQSSIITSRWGSTLCQLQIS
jgi:hypothetical protein